MPEVFHCHDWQTALIPILLKTLYEEDPAFTHTPCVFTIHNLGYQGLFPPEILPLLMLPWDLFTHGEAGVLRQGEFPEGRDPWPISSPRSAVSTARRSRPPNTASDWKACCALGGNTVAGILNGVDYRPVESRDRPYHRRRTIPLRILSGKAAVQADLLKEFGLAAGYALPVVGIVSRFAGQKGFDLIQQVADRLARRR